MSGSARCALCEAEGLFFKRFGEHCLYKCTYCESLFYHPFPAEHREDENPWESTKWYVERGANLLYYAEVLSHVRSVIETLGRQGRAETVAMLEMGCSYGFLMDIASVLFNWNVTGVDPSPCAQQGARDLDLTILNTRLEEAQFDKQFDAIVGVQLIEHIQNPRTFLYSTSQLIKENGFIVLTTPDSSVEDLGAEYSPGEHHILFSRKGFAPLLADTGLIHQQFFATTVPSMMGVIAAKTILPESTSMPASFNGAAAKQMTLDYLTKRIRSGPHPGPLGIGLYFRLFELLVNEGRYGEADAHIRVLETLMGMKEHESAYSFATRLFERMTAASSPSDYVEAGPGCLAPYLFYRGILNLNYKKDNAAAGADFAYAEGLFEHEVQRLSLIQYQPWLAVAGRHVEIAGGPPRKSSGEAAENSCWAVRKVEAAPFMRGGILEFCDNVPLGRLLRIGVRGGNAFIYTFTSMKDNLSGLSFDLMVKPYGEREPAELTLHLFEEFNPVGLRKTSRIIEFGSRAKLQRITEPFRFAPVRDSRGKNYSIVLTIGKDSERASVLCTSLKGASIVAGDRRHNNTGLVVIPYYYGEAHLRKHIQDKDSPLVSCLIVTHNSEGHIKHCLHSISRQDYPNIEIVVIDNHSNDRTAEIIREEFSHVNLFVMEKNLEFCKGNNVGVAKCKGKFICVLNADVVLEREAIRRFAEHLEISPHVAVVGSAIETKGSRTRYADTFIIGGLIRNDEILLADTRFSSAPCGAGFMIRRSVIDDLGYLFDEGFISNWEDHDLGLRCWLHGYTVLHIPELGLYHYGGSAYGLADPKRESQMFRNMLLTYFKNFGKRLFFKAFLKTLVSCTRPYRISGVIRFLSCFWKYIPERAALQRKRKIDDPLLQVMTSGFIAVIPENKKGV
jgi:GT2 family glycosyltransferase/2-polyprenyl-3-methyl-5-hydroxy-6-metoxy-1,4-benzoquinol methylase